MQCNYWCVLCLTLQGDILITKCTYNTEDRSKPTVVSSTQSIFSRVFILQKCHLEHCQQELKYVLLLSLSSFHLHTHHIFLKSVPSNTYICSLPGFPSPSKSLFREVLASWRKCVSTTCTTTLELSWSFAKATWTQDTCRNTLTSLTGSTCTKTHSLSLPFACPSRLILCSFSSILSISHVSNLIPTPSLQGTRVAITTFNHKNQMLCPFQVKPCSLL